MRPYRLTRRSSRRLLACTSSVVVHALALFLMTPWAAPHAPGVPGPDLGGSVDVTLVRAATLGLAAPHAPPLDAMQTEPAPSPAPAAASDAAAAVGKSDRAFTSDDQPSKPATPTPPQAVAWADHGQADVAAPLDGTRRGAFEARGGDPHAADELLAQIARCLPASLRPRLVAQRLILKLDAGGALAAAPLIESTLPLITAEQRAEADRVVQAALQCGPYRQASAAGQEVSLTVDFSTVRPAALSLQ
jgi:hypothetical protein